MTQLSENCFADAGSQLTVEEAQRLITGNVAPVEGVERVVLADACRRVLAEDVLSPCDLPPFDNSAVDGYAVRIADLDNAGRLPIEGTLAAGAAAVGPLQPGTACRVLTGAAIPSGADTVFMQEDVHVNEDRTVTLPAGLRRGANLRRAGEDVACGALALPRGRRLRAQDLALAAALGLRDLPVRRRVRVALFSTGNEIVEPGSPLGPAQRYDSNRTLLASLVKAAGATVTDLGILPDQAVATRRAIMDAVAGHDVILTSGGVSAGDEDHVRAVLKESGQLVFWRLAIKPGRPVAMALVGGVPAVGLPGNAVAAFVTFLHVVRPLLAALAGMAVPAVPTVPVVAGFSYRKKAGRREFMGVRLETGPDAVPVAYKHSRDGSAALTSLTETDGLVALPESATAVAPGDSLRFIPYELLL
ncbi:Molybdopterin molybdenumtransferase (plasmid) [Rhodovastum atsumiense]|uniref:molybdopterin molybdotransferase MoeA n=1 Tax=Rhodovastum atsumiense TaxID=504468 RepID=UPI0020249E9D|nr:gephyrin-like molybdotransferase Glp [Rhodovastum atsumiense]CAH2605576.1 Molybdopterin molybdenumtransferase [Rhodovastum atsumiense]